MNDARTYLNLIEPEAYYRLFLDYPPAAFAARFSQSGLPLFNTNFDLLTTADPRWRARLQKTPLFKYWSGLLNWSACFWGTTITEYAPFPDDQAPEDLLDEMLDEAGGVSLAVVKDLPSGSPLLPPRENEAAQKLVEAGLSHGFFELSGQALAYVPIDFTSVDEYLGRLSSSRRKDLRRKMKSASKMTVETLELGDNYFTAPGVLSDLYEMYLEVFRQSEIHFDLLSADFFKALFSGKAAPGLAVIYRHEGATVGFNICLIHKDCLIDKYIGFRYPLARQFNLYFVSWLQNLELALNLGLKFYVAGWTDPEVKAALGASFTFTRHLVWIRNPLLRKLLRPWRHLFEADKKTMGAL